MEIPAADRILWVDAKGRITLEGKIWKFFVQESKTKATSRNGIMRAVRKTVLDALKRGTKNAN